MAQPALIAGVVSLLLFLLVLFSFVVWGLIRHFGKIGRLGGDLSERVRQLMGPYLDSGVFKASYQGALRWKLEGELEGRPVVLDLVRGYRGSSTLNAHLTLEMPDRNPALVASRKTNLTRIFEPYRGSVTINGQSLFCSFAVEPNKAGDLSQLLLEAQKAALTRNSSF